MTALTPSSFSKGGSMHQKQPPAKVALSRPFKGVADPLPGPSALTMLDPPRSSMKNINIIVRFMTII
jgi:hypothetical protein